MKGASKGATQAPSQLPRTTFVLDNGAYNLKAGFAPVDLQADEETLRSCRSIPNCLVRTRDRKTYIAAQVEEVTQWSEVIFRRPLEKGQLVNWEAEKEIWDYSFFDEKTSAQDAYIQDPGQTTLLFTESANTMVALQKNADEIIVEEWGFGGYLRCTGPTLNAYNDLHKLFEEPAALKDDTSSADLPMECVLVVDSGYSHTLVTPVFEGRILQRAVRRLDFGGKHVTNLLKEVISIRHFDLHQDTKIINDIKEDVAFVASDFNVDLEKTWKGSKNLSQPLPLSVSEMQLDSRSLDEELKVDYVLPDGIHLLRGFSRPHDASVTAARKRKLAASNPDSSEVVMTLGNERFTAPEIIFNPSDVGSKQPGLTDCILQSLSVLPPLVQATMLANTLVVGGNAEIPGFVERLQDELRSRIKTEWPVRVRKMKNPTTSTWLGGARLASRHWNIVQEYAITREEYLEHGSLWASRKIAGNSQPGV